MSQTFDKLTEEKKNNIIHACISEFASHGYLNASTNSIVKKAGISKGALFNYFGNKKKLYFYMVDMAINRFIELGKQDTTPLSSDLFERLKERGLKKLKMATREPLLYAMIYNTFVNLPDNLKNEITSKYAWMHERSNDNLLEDLDVSLFRESINPEKAIEIVQLFLEGYFQKKMSTFKNMTPEESLLYYDQMNEECNAYFEEFKIMFYK